MSKVKQIPAYEQVFDFMRSAIKSGKWKVNEKIPSETELAEKFGVNRLTVRMALQRLNSMMLVETRIGDGTYVREFSFRDYIERITDFYMSPALLNQVCEFRMAVELACVELAMERGTDEEFDELKAICDEYEALKLKIEEEYSPTVFTSLVERDLAFHHKICSMSHNELFSYTFEIAREPIHQYILVVLTDRIETWINKGVEVLNWNDLHRDIYEAMRARDFAACQDAYRRMIDSSVEL